MRISTSHTLVVSRRVVVEGRDNKIKRNGKYKTGTDSNRTWKKRKRKGGMNQKRTLRE